MCASSNEDGTFLLMIHQYCAQVGMISNTKNEDLNPSRLRGRGGSVPGHPSPTTLERRFPSRDYAVTEETAANRIDCHRYSTHMGLGYPRAKRFQLHCSGSI